MDINNLSFGYEKDHLLINEFSTVLPENKITSIIGPNGCGKSTLLSLLNKLNKPKSGNILIKGQDIYELKGKDFARKVATVFQINEGNRDLSVREFVEYGRSPYKSGFKGLSENDKKIVEESLEDTGLIDLQDKKISDMSGGERQRVYIAMALCQEPEVLFLDEPTSFLDMYYQLEVLDIIKKVNKSKNITVVMVLHDINQAITYSDNIIVMKNGSIIKQGTVDIISKDLIKNVYGVETELLNTNNGLPHFVPIKENQL